MTHYSKELQEHSALLGLMPALESVIIQAAQMIAESIRNGGKLLLVGNGGSAADCQPLAAEIIGRCINDRRALPAIALTVDSSALTCVANDYDYVFSRQVEGLANKGDALIAIS